MELGQFSLDNIYRPRKRWPKFHDLIASLQISISYVEQILKFWLMREEMEFF